MILSAVLWVTMLLWDSTGHLFNRCAANLKLVRFSSETIQRFEAAEAGLIEGEKRLRALLEQGVSMTSHQTVAFTWIYANHSITIHITQQPHAFCILPVHRKGYYYQIISKAQRLSDSAWTKICLSSYVAATHQEPCSKNLTKRKSGRSSWCQLKCP